MENKNEERPMLKMEEYAQKLNESIEILKKNADKLSDEELALLVDQNKLCKQLFGAVFNILITEQVKRMNVKEGIEKELDE